MAICPFAVQQIIPESYSQGRITPTTLIYHRAVSSAESLLGYWTTPGVELESHFYIGQFGTIYQFMDTSARADANMDANNFAISVETWDGGNTPDSMAWSTAQLAAAKRLAAWVCETHGIKRAAAQTWNGGGIGGHNWFPYPWAGGPRGCPGTARNAQIRNDIIPYVAAGGGWRTSPQEDDVLTGPQEQWLLDLHKVVVSGATRTAKLNLDLGFIRESILSDIGAVKALLAAVIAAQKDDLSDADVLARLDAKLDEQWAEVERRLEQARQIDREAMEDAVRDVLGEDNAGQADEIVRKLGERLTGTEAA
jgi:hypothetical protein